MYIYMTGRALVLQFSLFFDWLLKDVSRRRFVPSFVKRIKQAQPPL